MQQVLTEFQLKELFGTVSRQPFALRNYCMLSMMFIHGLRVQELLALKLSDVDLDKGTLWINRCNNGISGIHPLTYQEQERLEVWLDQRSDYAPKNEVALFVTRNGEPWTRFGVMKMLGDVSQTLKFDVNSMALFYTCRHFLEKLPANEGEIRTYLGRDEEPIKLPIMTSLQRGFRRFDEACQPIFVGLLTSQNGPKCLLVLITNFLFANIFISITR